jgi:hypothetical protein
MTFVSQIWGSIQSLLFPLLEEELGQLSLKEQQFIRVCELCDLERLLAPYSWQGFGRPLSSRLAIAKAFIAKTVYNCTNTRTMIDHMRQSPSLRRLCGWETRSDIPSESTFSRAFDEFASGELPQKIHESMIELHYNPKLAGHISRDSSAIEAREKAVPKPKLKVPPVPKKRGRPKKGKKRDTKPPTRLELQPCRNLDDNLSDLPKDCDYGCKKNSNGYKYTWKGYKLHVDVIDGDIPVSAVLTSASVHDSQVAIPLAQMSAQRITNLYDLMDSAYDAPEIDRFSRQLGHVPIIDDNPRRGVKKVMNSAQSIRYRERSSVERFFSNLENFGSKNIRVRGCAKVMAHLMFGVIVVAAIQIFNLLPS